MNDRYKKYFDNISPEKKLTEDTLAKMYRELEVVSEPKKFDFRIWAALAACTAAAVSAVLFSPDIRNTGNSNSENFPVAENSSETLSTTICTSECTGSHTHSVVFTELSTDTSFEYTDTLISSVQHEVPVSAGTVSSAYEVTNAHKTTSEPVFTESVGVTSSEKIDVTESVSETPETTTLPEDKDNTLPPDICEPETTPCCTTGMQECVTITPDYEKPVSTMMSSEPAGIVDDPINSGSSGESGNPDEGGWYTEYINGYEIYINYAVYCYGVSVTEEERVELSKAEEVLGKGFIPESALSMSQLNYSYANAWDSSFDRGFCMSIGTTRKPVVGQDSYIHFSVSPSRPDTLGFVPVYEEPVYTYVNGTEYCFGVSNLFSNSYCTFFKNGLYYRIMFRGYELCDLIDMIFSI